MAASSEWWRGAVIYQIYPRSFMDANGDGIGDLPGITRKLGHVAGLGVDAIWLSPFFTSPMDDFGYDISDYRGVDPMFGNMADFEALVIKAHDLGLKVVIDQVFSHTASIHPWFVESKKDKTNPKADWYVWADPKDDGTPPTNWLSCFGGSSWEWSSGRRQYYLHNFLKSQPDLNFHNPEVRRALLDVARFWLDKGVDGFRLDTVNYYFHDAQLRNNPPFPKGYVFSSSPDSNPYSFQDHLYDKTRPENLDFLADLRQVMDSYPERMLVGELGADGPDLGKILAAYTEKDKRLHMSYVFELLTKEFSASHIRSVVERLTKDIGDGWICWSMSNHDVPRVISRWGLEAVADKAAPLLWALLLSLRGSACVYEGEELGLSEADVPFDQIQDPYGKVLWPEFKGRDGCRTPMPWKKGQPNAGFSSARPWLPVPEEHRARAVDAEEANPDSPLALCREFTRWRRDIPAFRTGDIRFHPSPEGTLAFSRTGADGGAEALACFNLSPSAAQLSLPGEGWQPAPLRGFQGTVAGGALSLAPYAAAFFQRP